jgi:hypothetical protein
MATETNHAAITPLPVAFRSGGFEFEQVEREGDIALFRKTKYYAGTGKRFETFEVVRIQEMDEHQWPNGDISGPHEYMPASESWGIDGFSFQTGDEAMRRFEELTQ